MPRPHIDPPPKLSLGHSLHQERHLMEQADVPIVTVSATFLGAFPSTEPRHHSQEIVLSRAHYSQALACLLAADRLDYKTWLIDPTNYVSAADWPKVLLTEKLAETMVRSPWLMQVRRLLENQARSKLPISSAIDDPLYYVTNRVSRPLLCLHYEAANLLVKYHPVLSVVTDPFVRDQYLTFAANPNMYYAVFDTTTHQELLAKANGTVKDLDKRVFVTGPPVDPRIVDSRRKKHPADLDHRPLRLGITTGGTGTNKPEIRALLDSLAPRLKGEPTTLQLLCYAGTHKDFNHLFTRFAQENQVAIGDLDNPRAEFRIIFGDHLMATNELLVKYAFPWADAIITKPSGDMAYDAAAAGCALLFLSPLGPWEEAIQTRFIKLHIGLRLAHPNNFAADLVKLEQKDQDQSLFQLAIKSALNLPDLYLNGATTIVKTLLKLTG